MNDCSRCKTISVYFVSIAGALLIMAAMVWLLRSYTTPPPLNAKRADERRAITTQAQLDANAQLGTYGWLDQAKGVARLPIADAMQLTVKNWQNPAAARSNLIERVEKANPPPPPPPPEKPSEFE